MKDDKTGAAWVSSPRVQSLDMDPRWGHLDP